jgi:hypothetical protein
MGWLDLEPYTLIVVIFLVLCVKQTIDFLGKQRFYDLGWSAYVGAGSKFGLSKSFELWNQKKLELIDVNKQKRAISAQDQYAKWTKLNRQADKLVGEIKTIESQIDADKSFVNSVVNKLLFVVATMPLWVFRIFFRKSILFYFPPGVLPKPLEWVLALPFVPIGGAGLTIWMFSVNRVVANIAFLVSFVISPKPKLPEKPAPSSSSSSSEAKIQEIN